MSTLLSLHLLIAYYLLVIVKSSHSSLEWSMSTTTLPRKDYGMIVGYSNTTNLIWLFGGERYPKQLVAFDPFALDSSSSPFIFNSVNALSNDTYDETQKYIQIDNIVYMIDETGRKFTIFNLSSQEIVYHYKNITIPYRTASVCLAHVEHYLFITGGRDTTDYNNAFFNVLIYDLHDDQWILSANHMIKSRYSHACIVYNDYLYVIGGDSDNGEALKTISKLYVGDMDNIHDYYWKDLEDTLETTIYNDKAVLYNHDIYVIDAYTVRRILANGSVLRDYCYFGGCPESLSSRSIIAVNETLFVLGGWHYLDSQDQATNFIQYATIKAVTANPATAPTQPSSNRDTSISAAFLAMIVICCSIMLVVVILVIICWRRKSKKQNNVRVEPLMDASKSVESGSAPFIDNGGVSRIELETVDDEPRNDKKHDEKITSSVHACGEFGEEGEGESQYKD